MELSITPRVNSNYNLKSNQNASMAKASNYHDVSFGDSFGMIKPEALHLKSFVFQAIEKEGFNVVKHEEATLPKEIIEQHYAGLKSAAQEKLKSGQDFLMKIYDNVVENMQKGPIERFIVKGDEAEVARFKSFVGATSYKNRAPESLRGMVEAKEVERLRASGASEAEITKFRDEFTFIHASDTDFFDAEQTIKNYDREIDIQFPGYRANA